MDRRRSRRTALDFAQAIGVLSRQHLALAKIAKRLGAAAAREAQAAAHESGAFEGFTRGIRDE